MDTSFVHISPDRWVIVSLIFGALSFLIPRRIPLILSGSAFITATISFIYPFLTKGCPLSTFLQLAIFSVTLILGLLFIQIATPSSSPTLKVADIFTLETPIKKGKGTLTSGDKVYTLIGPDCPASTQVKVVSVQQNTLYITPLHTEEISDE